MGLRTMARAATSGGKADAGEGEERARGDGNAESLRWASEKKRFALMRHKGGSRDLDGRRDVSEPAPDEDDVGGLDGDLCARASRARWNRDAANVAREMLGRRGPSRPSWCTCRRGSKSRETPTSRRGSVCERCRCYGHRSGWDVGDRGVLVRRTWACCEGARVAKKKSRGRTPRDALELAGLHESERFVSVRAEEEESAEDLGARAYSYYCVASTIGGKCKSGLCRY